MRSASIVRLCVFSATLLASVSAIGQSACDITLNNAQAEFDAGRFHAVPALLKDCLEKNQNREWEQRANLLLAETYLLLENPVLADESYLKVLRANPEFVTDEARDPIDLVYLSKKFTATPIFSLNGKIGLNTSFVRVIHDVKISSQGGFTEEYAQKVGWHGGAGVDYHYNTKITVGAEVNYAYFSYKNKGKGLFGNGNYSLDFTDRLTWLTMPLLVKYGTDIRGLRPFGMLGYSANLLIRNRTDIVIDGDQESPVYDYKYKRNSFNSSFIVGGGLKYKWGLRYLFGEVRYSFGLRNQTNQDNRDHQIAYRWPYVDDDFRMDNLCVSIGYIHPFYKARKLKNARTKSVLRKTRRIE